jgi:aspartyl/asparaginyl-tRNA synthetase
MSLIGTSTPESPRISLPSSNAALTVQGRVHKIKRAQSDQLIEILIKENAHYVAAILPQDVSDQKIVLEAASLTTDSLIRVSGKIREAFEPQADETLPTTKAMTISTLDIISAANERVRKAVPSHPTLENAQHAEGSGSASLNQRLDNRVMDARDPATAAIFKIFSGIHHIAVEHLHKHDFHWVASPKLISYQIPGDEDYFEVAYPNNRTARLTQTGEVLLGLVIAANFERVYDIHTVFRREMTVSPRHLTEVKHTSGWCTEFADRDGSSPRWKYSLPLTMDGKNSYRRQRR